jgi:hypothetical protein
MNDTAKRVDEALAAGADDAKIKELAALSAIKYGQRRKEEAKKLGIRPTDLDFEVKRERKRTKTGPVKEAVDIKKLEDAAGDLITCPGVLERFEGVINDSLVGETDNAKLLYLALTSRLFDREICRPVSIAVKGVSAGGKSFTCESVLKFFPESAYFARSALSDKALYFTDENLKHRFIVLWEAVGMGPDQGTSNGEVNHLAYAVRTLLSENRLSYELPIKTEDGIKSQVIEKEGPTGLITTTTATRLHPENETRLLSLGIVDTPEQTQAVMRALATGRIDDTDYAPWRAFQEWLAAGERRVVVPFAVVLAEMIPPLAVRLRRDFSALLSLIRAHALLHRQTRARDDQGWIVAAVADYAAVYNLVKKLFGEGIEATVPATVRETVEAVKRCLGNGGGDVSLTALAKALRLDKNSVHHRVGKAIKAGYLLNNQERRGKPAQIVLGEPLPEEQDLLPAPEALECGGEYYAFVVSPGQSTPTLQHLGEKPNPNNNLGTVGGVLEAKAALQHSDALLETCIATPTVVQHPSILCDSNGKSTTVGVLEAIRHPSTSTHRKDRPAPGVFTDAKGKPTDDPELGFYGRVARASFEEAYQAATETQLDAVAEVPHQVETQPPASPPDPQPCVPPSQVVADAVADVPNQAEKAPPAADVISTPDPVPARPMLEGDRQRALRLVRNKEAVARDDAAMKARLH